MVQKCASKMNSGLPKKKKGIVKTPISIGKAETFIKNEVEINHLIKVVLI